MDLKQRFAILNKYKKVVRELCDNELTINSGIYMFYRTNENGERCFYVGQAKNLLQRTAEHLMGKKQHIDKSIYVHKLYSEDNPTGWKLRVLINCREEDLDHFEKFYIDFNKQQGVKNKVYSLETCCFIPNSENAKEVAYRFATPIVATNIETGEKIYFKSQAEASRCLGCSQGNISMCLRKERNHCCGYTWEFVGDTDE